MLDVEAIRERVERERMLDRLGPHGAKMARPDLFGVPLLLGFIHHFGHIQYRDIRTRDALWAFVAEMSACEIDPVSDQEQRMVFDHCHRHGWVRGMLCRQHNLQLGHLEAAMKIEGVAVDLGSSVYAHYLALCPECAGADVIQKPLATVSTLQALLLQ